MQLIQHQTTTKTSQNPKTDPLAPHKCKCGCGGETKRAAGNTKRHKKGEYQDFIYQHGRISHGCTRFNTQSPEYASYLAAKRRCLNPNSKDYPLYGGRGIRFEFKDFGEFFDTLGFKPSPRHTIDRIDSDGHYEASNVRWSSRTENNRHRRGIILDLDKADAIRICVQVGFPKKELAKRFGVGVGTIWKIASNRAWVRE